MRYAKWVFLLAGITGVLMVIPPYFLEQRFGQDNPPPVNHPEFYYGFFGAPWLGSLCFWCSAKPTSRPPLAAATGSAAAATDIIPSCPRRTARNQQNPVNRCAQPAQVFVTMHLLLRTQETLLLREAVSDLPAQARSDPTTNGVADPPGSHDRLSRVQRLGQRRADPHERRKVRTPSRDSHVKTP